MYLFLNSIPIGYMNVVPLIYLVQVGYSPGIVSAIYAAGAISNTIGLTPFGILADRLGHRKFLIIGSAVPAVSYVIFGLTLDPLWLVLASAVGGVGLAGGMAVAISGPSLLPVIADTSSERNRTLVFGWVQTVWTISLTIGSFLSSMPDLFTRALSFSEYTAHSLSYFVMAVVIVVSIAPLFLIGSKRNGGSKIESAGALAGSNPSQSNFKRKPRLYSRLWKGFHFASATEIKRFALVYALSGLGLGVSVQLVATWYNLNFHVSESVAGFWIGLADLISASSILLIPLLVRRFGTVRASMFTGLISALFLLGMPFSPVFAVAAAVYIARSLFINISWPILQSYVMGIIDPRERAAATGIATTAWGVTASAGTLLGGVLLSAGLLTIPFVVGALGYLASALALGYLFRGIKPPEEKADKLQSDSLPSP